MSKLKNSPAFQALEKLYKQREHDRIAHWFDGHPERVERFSGRLGALYFDYSKQFVDGPIMAQLLDLAEERGVLEWRDAMFNGERINRTEDRPVLHIALRNRNKRPIIVDGQDVNELVDAELEHMRQFVRAVHSGKWRGYTGDRITDIVNIGIGGSDLGPRMVCHALGASSLPGIRAHFVSNVAPSDLSQELAELDPAKTLFVVASKSFGTQETLANAREAKKWILREFHDHHAIAKHFVAVSTNTQAVADFGIDTENMFGFWDWVGGRYSLWSSIGLPIALYIGMDGFEQLLQGAFEADEAFRNDPPEENLCLKLGLIDVWNNNVLGAGTLAVLPYCARLFHLPAYLQQAAMESNGKSVMLDGERVDFHTSPVFWGGIGTDSQHAFFQSFHQGTRRVPADFIASINTHTPLGKQQPMLLANFLAQTRALMYGRTLAEVKAAMRAEGADEQTIEQYAPHRVCPGNQPNTTILIPKMNPRNLGTLIAHYEHRIFVAGAVWGIDSFDQWGVELGKQMAGELLPFVGRRADGNFDPSTDALLNIIADHTPQDQQ